MSRLSTPAYPNDAPIHGLADRPLRLLPTGIGCGTPAPCSQQDTATPTARDSSPGSGNQGMFRPSALAYPTERCAHPRPCRQTSTCACSQRILGVAPLPLALDKTRQHPLLATQAPAVATRACLDYLHSHTRPMRPSTALPMCLYARSQRILGVAPLPLALTQALQHPLLATQASAVATTTCLDYLHSHARPMRPSTTLPMYLYACSQRILGVVPSPLAHRPDTHNTTTSALLTPSRRKNYVPASPGDHRQMEHTCMPIAPSPVHYFNGYWVWRSALHSQTTHGNTHCLRLQPRQGNHDTPRLPAFACPNDAPIHALPKYLYACSQRVLGVVPCPSLPDQTHTTPQLRLNWRSHAQKTIRVQLLSIFVTARAFA
jgi:uncharacterized protein YbdZ (MbtH family)